MTVGAELVNRIETLDPDVIFVDYFETVVRRSVTGKQLKVASARFLSECHAGQISPENALASRLEAEAQLRTECAGTGADDEHRLDDLVVRWRKLLVDDYGLDPTSVDLESFSELAIEIEMRLELAAQTPADDVVAALRDAAPHRLVILVSDFHIPHPWFARMLEHHEIDDLFDEVVVSCDHGMNKASGRLYPIAIDIATKMADPAGPPPTMLMVGDNPHSDQRMAEKHNITSHLVPTKESSSRPARQRIERRWETLLTVRRSRLHQTVNVESPTPGGFSELAITLYAFVEQLHSLATSKGIDRFLFLAREGKFLRELFDLYQELAPRAAGARIETSYLMVSRRSTLLPACDELAHEEFASIVAQYPQMTNRDLLMSLGVDTDVLKLGDTVLDGPLDLDLLRTNDHVHDVVEHQRLEQRDLLRALIDQCANRTTGPLHVVDVGWKGTMQDHLQAVVGAERPVAGYYIGVTAGAADRIASERHGILFDEAHPTPTHRIFRHFKSLFEILLQADHGSVKRYRPGVEGVDAVVEEHGIESAMFHQLVAPAQDQIRRAFVALCRADAVASTGVVIDHYEVARAHARMLFFPTAEERALMAQMVHYENFGTMGFVQLAEDPTTTSQRERMASLVRIAGRPSTVFEHGWPPLYLANRGLEGLIPLLGMYRQIREVIVPDGVRRIRDRAI